VLRRGRTEALRIVGALPPHNLEGAFPSVDAERVRRAVAPQPDRYPEILERDVTQSVDHARSPRGLVGNRLPPPVGPAKLWKSLDLFSDPPGSCGMERI
jgi:hypothetical protein